MQQNEAESKRQTEEQVAVIISSLGPYHGDLARAEDRLYLLENQHSERIQTSDSEIHSAQETLDSLRQQLADAQLNVARLKVHFTAFCTYVNPEIAGQ